MPLLTIAERLAECTETAALDAAGELGLFEHLAAHPATAAQLAARDHLHPTALRVLLEALAGCGLLTSVDGGAYSAVDARTPVPHAPSDHENLHGLEPWMIDRLRLDREFFWQPLAGLAETVRTGLPGTYTSRPGCNGAFRAAFTRVNMPLLPVLLRAARRAVHDLELSPRPQRVLELGTSLGHWGMAFAAAHPMTTVVSVDAADVLPIAQRIIASAKLGSRYRWHAEGTFASAPAVDTHPFDVVILHEICHTLQPDHLERLLDSVVSRLAPDGALVVADMLLDATRTAPRRHLLSALKLLVTGGGTLLDVDSACSLIEARGFSLVQHHRLPITDLVLGRR